MRLALATGLAAVAATTGVLLSSGSAGAVKCVVPNNGWVQAGPVAVNVCNSPFPGCDPAPCPPTEAAPQD